MSKFNYKMIRGFVESYVGTDIDRIVIADLAREGRGEGNWGQLKLSPPQLMEAGRSIANYLFSNSPIKITPSFLSNKAISVISKEYGNKIKYLRYYCRGAKTECFVRNDGKMFPCQFCGSYNESSLPWPWKFKDNNLFSQSFQNIWKSKGFQNCRKYRSKMLHRSYYTTCKKCRFSYSYCWPCTKHYFNKNPDPFPICSYLNKEIEDDKEVIAKKMICSGSTKKQFN